MSKSDPLSAEDTKHLAEAESARAEARLHLARASKAEIEAEYAGLTMEMSRHTHEQWLNSDEMKRVYRFNSGVSDASVKRCMTQLTEWHRADDGAPIEVIFNSPGGSIFDGMALFDFITDLRAAGTRVTTGTFGMAASMAGILLQAGDERWMSPQSWLLVHRASFGACGATFDVEDQLELIHRIEDRILDIFVNRSGGKITREFIKERWGRKDWWLTPEEAMELGLVDYLRGAV